jgi:hypothetical protein
MSRVLARQSSLGDPAGAWNAVNSARVASPVRPSADPHDAGSQWDLLLRQERREKEREHHPGRHGADPVERELALARRLPVCRHRLRIPGQHHVVVRLRQPV